MYVCAADSDLLVAILRRYVYIHEYVNFIHTFVHSERQTSFFAGKDKNNKSVLEIKHGVIMENKTMQNSQVFTNVDKCIFVLYMYVCQLIFTILTCW